MKEEWLFPNAIVPIDVETTVALVAEIKRLIHVIGGMALAQPEQEPVLWMMPDGGHREEVAALREPKEWVSLTEDEVYRIAFDLEGEHWKKIADAIEAKFKDKNT